MVIEKNESLTRTLKELQLLLHHKTDFNRFEEFKRAVQEKLEELSMKQRDFGKRYDPALAGLVDIDRLFKMLKELEIKFKTLSDKVDPLQGLIGELKDRPANSEPQPQTLEKSEKTVEIPVNSEKLNELEVLILRTREDVASFGNMISALGIEVAKKVDVNEFTIQINKKLDKDEMLKLVEKITLDDERSRKLQKEMAEILKKVEKLQDSIDKKIHKLKKDLDLNQIQKLLKSKADQEEVGREFAGMDEKLQNALSSIVGFRKEIDGLISNFKKMASSMYSSSNEASTLASTKNALCLSCGRGGDTNYLPQSYMVKGYDGKMYYGDPGRNQSHYGHGSYDIGSNIFTRNEGVREHETHAHGPFALGKQHGESISMMRGMAPATQPLKISRPQGPTNRSKKPQ